VVGFKANPKPCGFILKLVRDDGTVITGSDWHSISIYSYTDRYNWVDYTETYDAVSQKFTLAIDPADVCESGYWIKVEVDDSIATQYPYRYKSADQLQLTDRIQVGEYEIKLPYWKSSAYAYTPTPTNPDWEWAYDPDPMMQKGSTIGTIDGFSKARTIYSSVPYQVEYRVTCTGDGTVVKFYVGHHSISGRMLYTPNGTFMASSGDGLMSYVTTIPATNKSATSGWLTGSVSGAEKSLTMVVTDKESVVVGPIEHEDVTFSYSYTYITYTDTVFRIIFTYE